MRGGLVVAALLLAMWPSQASAWEWFRRENPDVREGNARMAEGEFAAALESYESAARSLPGEPGVHLDRGLALLGTGDLDAAREALRLASEHGAPAAIRADAFYDLGLAFYRQGDAAAAEDHEAAQRAFREAADAFRSSLRQRPGNRDAGWNLELALRRIQEQAEAEQQERQQEQQDQEQQDQQDPQDQDQQGQQNQDPQNPQDQDQQGQQNQDSQDPQDQDQQGQQNQEPRNQDPQDPQARQDEAPEGDEGRRPEEGAPGEGEQPTPTDGAPSEGTPREALPEDARRVLDALRDGEENLERELARARGAREQRRVTQDW